MDAASVHFGRRLVEIIRAKQSEMSKPLLMGQALDYPDYRARAGYLRALADVISWMEKVSMEDEDSHVGGL